MHRIFFLVLSRYLDAGQADRLYGEAPIFSTSRILTTRGQVPACSAPMSGGSSRRRDPMRRSPTSEDYSSARPIRISHSGWCRTRGLPTSMKRSLCCRHFGVHSRRVRPTTACVGFPRFLRHVARTCRCGGHDRGQKARDLYLRRGSPHLEVSANRVTLFSAAEVQPSPTRPARPVPESRDSGAALDTRIGVEGFPFSVPRTV